MPPITGDLNHQILNLLSGRGYSKDTDQAMDVLTEKMDSVLDALRENSTIKVDKNGKQRLTGLAGDGYNIDVVGATEKSQKLKMKPLEKKVEQKKKEIEALKEFKQKIKGLQNFMDNSVGGGNVNSIFGKKRADVIGNVPGNEIIFATAQPDAKLGTHNIEIMQLASDGNILSRKFSIESLNTSNYTGNIVIKKDGELLHTLKTERDSKTGMVMKEKIIDNSNINLLHSSIDNFFSKLDELEAFSVSKVKNEIDNTYVYSVKYSGQGNITFEDDQGGNIVNAIFDNTIKTSVQNENYSNLVFDRAYNQTDNVISYKGGVSIEIYEDKNCTKIIDNFSFPRSSVYAYGSNITYSQLIEMFEKRGYTCTQIQDVTRNDGATYLKIEKDGKDVYFNMKSGDSEVNYGSNILLPNADFDSNDPVTFGSVKLISEGFDLKIALNKAYHSMNDLCADLNTKIHAENNDIEAFVENLNGNHWQQTIGFRHKLAGNGYVELGVEYEATENDSFKTKQFDFYINNIVFDKSYAYDETLFLSNLSDFKFKFFSDAGCTSLCSPIEITKADFGVGKITFRKFINKIKEKFPGIVVSEISDPKDLSKKYLSLSDNGGKPPIFLGGNLTYDGRNNIYKINIEDRNTLGGSPFNPDTDKVFLKGLNITNDIVGKSLDFPFIAEKGKTLQEWCTYFNEELPKDQGINLPVKINAKMEGGELLIYSSEPFYIRHTEATSGRFYFKNVPTESDGFVPFVNSVNVSKNTIQSFNKTIGKFHTDDIDDLYRGVVSKYFDDRDTALNNISGSVDISINGGEKKRLVVLNTDTLDTIAEKVKKLDENLSVFVRKTEVPIYPTPPDTDVKLENKYVLQISGEKNEDNISFYAVSSSPDNVDPDYKNSADLMVSLGLIDGTDQSDPTRYPACVLSNTSDSKNNAFIIKNSNIISRAFDEVSKPLICKIDGVLIENNSNTLNNNLQGIAIECNQKGKAEIKVVPDIAIIHDNMKNFINLYNDFIIFSNEQLKKKKDIDKDGKPIIKPDENAYLYHNDIFKEAVKKIKTAVLSYQGAKKLQKENFGNSYKNIAFLSDAGIIMKMKEHFDDEDTDDIGTLVIDDSMFLDTLERKSEEFIDFMKIFLDFGGVKLDEAKGQFLTEFDFNELNIFLTKEGGERVFKKFMKKYDFNNIAIMSNSISKTTGFDAGQFVIKRNVVKYNTTLREYEKLTENLTITGNKTPEEFVTAFNNIASYSDNDSTNDKGSHAVLEPDPYDDSKTRIVIYGGGHNATYPENGVNVTRKEIDTVEYYIESTNDAAVNSIFNNVKKSGNKYEFTNVFKCDSDCNVVSGGSNVRISKYSDQKDLLGTKVVGAVFSVNDFAQFINGKRIQFKHNFTGTMLNALNEIYTSGVIRIASDTADRELKNIQETIGKKEQSNANELEIVRKKQADMDAMRAKANEAHTRLKAIIKSLHSDS